MKVPTIFLLIATCLFAGFAGGADEQRAPGPPTQSPAPAPTPGSADYCTRRDISPEDYAKNCVIQNGPAHRHIIRGDRGQSRSGAGTGTR